MTAVLGVDWVSCGGKRIILRGFVALTWNLNDAGEGPVAAAGNTARRNDGTVGRRLGVSAAQSVFVISYLTYVVRKTQFIW